MFRIFLLMLALSLVPVSSMAEAPLTFAEDLSVLYTWPENVNPEEASYIYRAVYPQIAGESSLALTINQVFQYEADDALGFEAPMIGSSHDPAQGQMQVDISYQIVHLSDRFLSVRVDKTIAVDESISHIVKGYTFTLTGAEAGTVTSLPYMAGIIRENETDEWLIGRQIAKADACVRDMVWFLIERDMKKNVSAIYEDMTFEEFEWGFYPEEDFYLNEDGSFVFFIQAGIIAPAEAGAFYYTITLDELLDEI